MKLEVIAPDGRRIPHVGTRLQGECFIVGQDIDETLARAIAEQQPEAFRLIEDNARLVRKKTNEEINNGE